MRKFLFRFLAGAAIFLSCANHSNAQISVKIINVSIGNTVMAKIYSDPAFWRQGGSSTQAKRIEEKAMHVIDEFENEHYDLYLAWLRGEQRDNDEIKCLEQKLVELYYEMEDTISASSESTLILQK